MPKSGQRIARFAVAAALIGYLLFTVSPGELWSVLARTYVAGIAVAVALALAGHLLVAERIRCLTAALGLPLPFWALFKINLSAVFYGLVLPAGNLSGVAARLYQMARAGGAYAEPAVALTLERLVATVTLGAVGALFWLVERPPGSWPVFVLLLASTVAFGALQLAMFRRLPLIAPLWRWLAARSPRKLASLRDAMERARGLPWRVWLPVFGLGFAVHLIGVAAFCLVAWSLGLEMSVWTVGWTRSAAILVAILPVSVAGLGVREGALVILLAPYGIDATDAIAYGLLAFATTILAVGLLGGVLEGRRWLESPA